MGQYKSGTVSVSNGSAVVTGIGTVWLASLSVGDSFKVSGVDAVYSIAAISTDTQLTLNTPWAGSSLSDQSYQVMVDWTPNVGLGEIWAGDKDWMFHLTMTLRSIDSLLASGVPDFDTLTEKPSIKPGDLFVIEDSEDSWTKKKYSASSILGIGRQAGSVKIEDSFTQLASNEECIHGHRPIVNGYIYFGTETWVGTNVAKLWKVNLDDFTDYDSITFTADAYHKGVSDCGYCEANGKIYVSFRDSGYIAEIDLSAFTTSDVITNTTNLGGTALAIDGTDLYLIGQTTPNSSLYKYDLTDYSLTASNTSIAVDYSHSIVVSDSWAYGTNGEGGAAVTLWRFNKTTLAVDTSKTFADIYGGAHDLVISTDDDGADQYIWIPCHGQFVESEPAYFARVDITNFDNYDIVTFPAKFSGSCLGVTQNNGKIYMSQAGKPGGFLRIDPDTLEYEAITMPYSGTDYTGDYYYSQGPLVFDDKGRMFFSTFPDLWGDEAATSAKFHRATLDEIYRPYDTEQIILQADTDDPLISIQKTAIYVASHSVTIDVDTGGGTAGTITAGSGTPYQHMYAGQVIELSGTPDNDNVYTISTVTNTVITTTAVIDGNDYSGTCVVRARLSNRGFIQAQENQILMGAYNADSVANADLSIWAGQAEKMFIDGSTGYFGFGMNSPSYFMDVKKPTTGNIFNYQVNGVGSYIRGVIGAGYDVYVLQGVPAGNRYNTYGFAGGASWYLGKADTDVVSGNVFFIGQSLTGANPYLVIDTSKNLGLNTPSQFGSGSGVFGMADAATNPSTNPSNGIILYSDSGELKVRDSSGNVTTLSPHARRYPANLVTSHMPAVRMEEKDGHRRYIEFGKMAELVEELAARAGLLGEDQHIVIYEDI